MDEPLRLEPVRDLDDPRLADYRNVKDAELLARRGRFIVEGRGNLRVLLERSDHRPESILLGETAFAALRPELERCAGDVPVFVAKQAVLDGIVGFKIHRGALAACRRKPALDADALAGAVLERSGAGASPFGAGRPGAGARVVVLEAVRDADNVGGIFRSAWALGASAVFACPRSCDPLYRKAIRTSMGGSLCVPFARVDGLPDFLGRLRGLGFSVLAFDPKEPAEALDATTAPPSGPLALLFGTEGEGLSAAALGAADRRVRIAMEPGVDSLNVATAAAIGLFAMRAR